MLNTPKLHPMYQQMADNGFSIDEIKSEGGYFEDGYTPECCELNCYVDYDSLYGSPDLVIGISGAFNPFHEGHFECLKLARAEFEKMGYKKVVGVVFPAHDSYALTKDGGKTAEERVKQIKSFLGVCSWIRLENYPAYCWEKEVNFPYLIDRMKEMFPNSETAFVFGGDNAGFAYAFENSPTWAVVVNRHGINLDLNKLKNTKLKVINDNRYSHVSSTIKRQKPIYAIRDDSYFISYLSGGYKPKLTPEILAEKVQEFFPETEVVLFDAMEQLVVVNDWLNVNKGDCDIVFLDKWSFAQHNLYLDVSRLFQLGDKNSTPEETFLGLNYRESQFDSVRSSLTKDKIVFVDDDISTGATKNTILEFTKDWGKECEFISMLDFVSQGREVFDVIDYRDFIPNAQYGGLLTLGGRVCYTDPRIDLTKRMRFANHDLAAEFKKSLDIK